MDQLYDPRFPNEYEAVLKARETLELRRQAEKKALENIELMKHQEAQVQLDLSGEEAYRRRAMLSQR
jgi:hypothetical protein